MGELTADERRAPVNGQPGGTIAWSEHVKAWEAYHRQYRDQDAERIARRGGFGLVELLWQLGHMPTTWLPDHEAQRQFERSRVTFAQVALAARAAQGSDLAAKVAALADEWTEWSRTRSTPRIDAFRDAAEELRALLADPADTGDGSGT